MGFYQKLLACVCAVIAYGLGLWLHPVSFITFLLGILIGSWFASLFHELGHLLAYRLLKLKWLRLEFSCFVFEQGKGMRVDTRKRFFSASCTCAYNAAISFWRYRLALLSGGLLCLLLCIASAVAFFFSSGILKSFLLCFGIANGLNTLINLLPFSADRVLLKQIKQERENLA